MLWRTKHSGSHHHRAITRNELGEVVEFTVTTGLDQESSNSLAVAATRSVRSERCSEKPKKTQPKGREAKPMTARLSCLDALTLTVPIDAAKEARDIALERGSSHSPRTHPKGMEDWWSQAERHNGFLFFYSLPSSLSDNFNRSSICFSNS